MPELKQATQPTQPMLTVEGLTTEFHTRAGVATAVNDVSFSVMPGQIMGLVGESGSGKSMTGYSIMGLIDAPGKVVGGQILLKGQDLRAMSAEQMRQVRGDRIAMIFQDPMMTLNPVLRIDTQMTEAIFAHHKVSKSAAMEMARDALVRVGIPSPDERLMSYPHQFSGGMRQRVAIAIALLNKPDLIICDEPTTALDVTIQGQILFEMQKLCRESGTSLIWITHDLSVIAGLADTVSVMYAGRIVESGTVEQVLNQPRHPYTYGLIASAPSRNPRGQALHQIPGMTPSLLNLPVGCAFRERCSQAQSDCANVPALTEIDGRSVRCFHPAPLESELVA
ncbi:peptide/nickel transport system ATP-binding protein [Undibacterium sp. GrIS 1.8]|uniref:ABC transporter ATP-binding protein n=1 Tax=unclassified Undibacterium TaxID=2630295 RepID=UPI0033972F23